MTPTQYTNVFWTEVHLWTVSVFFPPFSSYVSFHDWFTASVGTRDTMKLQDFDAVENTCNFTSTTAVSCWSDSRSSICSVSQHRWRLTITLHQFGEELVWASPRAKGQNCAKYVKIDSQVENQRNMKWLTGSEGKLSPKWPMRFMFHALSNGMGWKWRQTHAIWQQKQIWNMSRKEIQLKKSEKCKWQIGGAQVANWRKGEKQLYSRTQCTFASLVNEKVRVHVSSRPILCVVVNFQWKFLPQSATEEKFPGYRPFVLPTHNHVSWGTWLVLPTSLMSFLQDN